MVHFRVLINEGTARQVESAALELPAHCVIKQEVI